MPGANYSVNDNNLFGDRYWTRPPIEEEDNDAFVSRCNMNGTINNDFVSWCGSFVQPAITI